MTPTPRPSPDPTPAPGPIPVASLDDDRHGPVFWGGLVVGGALMAYGVHGVLTELGPGNPFKLAEWVVGLDLIHDLLLAPIVVVLGLLAAWALPTTMRGPVRAAAALSGVVVLFSIPLLTGWGRRAGNSSTLPLDYARNVVIVLAVIWAVAAVVAAARWVRR